ncbi:MAG: hypothetical protein HKN41_13070, partial [Ilumatobacter sp.]|nr:hypothetical protein [Ilumatobacter sp.]
MTSVRRGVAVLTAVLIAAACGATADGDPVADSVQDEAPATSTGDTATTIDAGADPDTSDAAPTPTGVKPDVQIPDAVPTELVVTDLIEGSGPEAAIGDTVVVQYVGVRSEDGVEFDNNFDSGTTFPLTLGTNSVIQGWEQGLLGAQAGDRRQLDIPAALAYGDQARGDVIRAGDALTFVIDVLEVQTRPAVTAPPQADPAECPATDGSEPKQQQFDTMQPFCIDVTKTYTAEIVTNFGDITVELLPEQAPQNVNNFVTLARYQYFDGTQCHRVLTDFVVQCGDPDATGFGGPGYTIPDELPLPGQYGPGSIAMANTGQPDSAGSQFFIITGPNGAALPPQYSLFGEVIGGYDTTVTQLNTLENP